MVQALLVEVPERPMATSARVVATTIAYVCIVSMHTVRAQSVEVAPYGGYRFGSDLFEVVAGRPLDMDGAPAVGLVFDVPLAAGLQVEGMFSHQQAFAEFPLQPLSPPTRWRISVDHWQGGGLQEFTGGRVRPFLTGTFGLTRYAAADDNEIRFTIGTGGGVKLFPTSRLGVRLDGRVFATFLDANGTGVVCGGRGACLLALHVNVAWQTEFTAGLIFRFR
jgi:hypothetical protein